MVAHSTPLNPFRLQLVAVFGRGEKPQILRRGPQWEVHMTLVHQPVPLAQGGHVLPNITWTPWEAQV